MLDTSHQTINKIGTQTHPSEHRLPKVILSSQTPQNTPPDMALLIRGKRLNSTHPERRNQSLLSGSLYKTLEKPHHWGHRTEARGTTTLQPREGDLKYCKLDKMRRQRNILQEKEQDKTHKTRYMKRK